MDGWMAEPIPKKNERNQIPNPRQWRVSLRVDVLVVRD